MMRKRLNRAGLLNMTGHHSIWIQINNSQLAFSRHPKRALVRCWRRLQRHGHRLAWALSRRSFQLLQEEVFSEDCPDVSRLNGKREYSCRIWWLTFVFRGNSCKELNLCTRGISCIVTSSQITFWSESAKSSTTCTWSISGSQNASETPRLVNIFHTEMARTSQVLLATHLWILI